MVRWFSPASIAWVLCHLSFVFLGIFFLRYEPIFSSWGKGVTEGIGSSLIATGITGEILFLHLRASDTIRARLDIFIRAGLIGAFPFRSMLIRQEYEKYLPKAKEIDIIGFGLSSLRQDYERQFQVWAQQAKVRILVIDPDYPNQAHAYASQRDREENNPVGSIHAEVSALERILRANQSIDRNKFLLRKMRALPSINMFRIDGVVFWGPYLMEKQSRNTLTLLAERGGFIYDVLLEHFEALWSNNNSTPVNF
jgi:hypothetical protein